VSSIRLTTCLPSNLPTYNYDSDMKRKVLLCESYTEYYIIFSLYFKNLNMHFIFFIYYISRSVYTISKSSDESLLPGDKIFYSHLLYPAGDSRGRITVIVRDIDPNCTPPLRLDNMDCLNMYDFVKCYKILQPDGKLLDNEKTGKWWWIKHFNSRSQSQHHTGCALRVPK
jgi:hypothetical protein